MRDLWKALALLATDEALRKEVMDSAKFDEKPELGKQLENQPDVTALRNIDKVYRTRGLYLGVYALAEINRWVLEHREPFKRALDDFRVAIASSLKIGQTLQNPGFLEAIGALVSDPLLRDQFGKNEQSLQQNGFQISSMEEEALRKDFTPGSNADAISDQIFELGWSGQSCESRMFAYQGMFHMNI